MKAACTNYGKGKDNETNELTSKSEKKQINIILVTCQSCAVN